MERRYWFFILTSNVLFISFNNVDTSCTHFQVINGDVLIVSSQVPEANVYCDDGYQLVGVSRLFCISGNWNDTLPKCLIDCRSLQNITNGIVTNLNGTTFKSVALYSCDLGYSITGTEVRTCLADGSWSGSQPACNVVDCKSLQNITNGIVTHPNGTTFKSVALYSCDLGYSITGTEVRTCLADGSWSGSQPACNVVDCKSLKNITNGIVTHLNGTTFKSAALYSCDLGYTITGTEFRSCLANGLWSGSQPACNIVDCKTLQNISNGIVTHLNGTTFKSAALYSCDLGYIIYDSEYRTCLANGSWSGSQPSCNIVDCKSLQNIANEKVTHLNGTTFKSVALYSCDLGYTITGNEYPTCFANGSWSGSQPSCNIVGKFSETK